MGKTIAQAFIEEGMELGKELGKAEGMALGVVTAKQEAVIKLLRGKFDQSSQTLIEKIVSIRQVEQLDALFDRALRAQTLDEVGIG
ncbi:hypothetical protein HYR99_13280 [Candidatus Poribacteria bacterium]|nr:hypothetical protein [Candidatus Poribacteria bacterium]